MWEGSAAQNGQGNKGCDGGRASGGAYDGGACTGDTWMSDCCLFSNNVCRSKDSPVVTGTEVWFSQGKTWEDGDRDAITRRKICARKCRANKNCYAFAWVNEDGTAAPDDNF